MNSTQQNQAAAAFIVSYLQSKATTRALVQNVIQISDSDTSDADSNEGEESTSPEVMPGRGVPKSGLKSSYVRTPGVNFESFCREHHNPATYKNICGLDTAEFDALWHISEDALKMSMNSSLDRTASAAASSASRVKARLLSPKEQLFLFMYMLRGGPEGARGVSSVATVFGISNGTVTNTFRHVLMALLRSLKAVNPALISWPSREKRQSMRGLINGFPSVVAFVDGSKQRAWRPGDPVRQEFIFCGHHHFHCYTVLYWCDVFGNCIRLDFTHKGSMHDRGLYNETDVGQHPERYFTSDTDGTFIEHGLADTGFQGDGPILTPHKRNQAPEFDDRAQRNSDIRKQRMCNEWGIGTVNNRFRLFLGRWGGDDVFFPLAYEVAVMIIALCNRKSGTVLVPLDRLLARQEQYEATTGNNW